MSGPLLAAGLIPGAGAEPPTVTYLGLIDANSGNVVVPRAGVLVILAGCWRDGAGTRYVNTVTIGGAASFVVRSIGSGGAYGGCGIGARAVSAGSVAVSVGFAGGSLDGGHGGFHAVLVEGYENGVESSYASNTYDATQNSASVHLAYPNASVALFCHIHAGSSVATAVANGEMVAAANPGGGQALSVGKRASDGGEGSIHSYFSAFAGTQFNGNACGLVIS